MEILCEDRYAVYSLSEKSFIAVWETKSLTKWDMTNELHKIRSYKRVEDATKLRANNPDFQVVKLSFVCVPEMLETQVAIDYKFDTLAPEYARLFVELNGPYSESADRKFRIIRKQLRALSPDRFEKLNNELKAAER